MSPGEKTIQRGRHLHETGSVRPLHLDPERGLAVAYVINESGRGHLVTVASTQADAPAGTSTSSCTCKAGRNDVYCAHLHALLLELGDEKARRGELHTFCRGLDDLRSSEISGISAAVRTGDVDGDAVRGASRLISSYITSSRERDPGKPVDVWALHRLGGLSDEWTAAAIETARVRSIDGLAVQTGGLAGPGIMIAIPYEALIMVAESIGTHCMAIGAFSALGITSPDGEDEPADG